MSEIYLTKIERKTIFTRALIFVLVMCIISDLTVTGPFWFNTVDVYSWDDWKYKENR